MTTQPEAAMTREQVLEEALRPFAQMADEVEREYGQDLPDFQLQFPRVTMGQLRAARAALRRYTGDGVTEEMVEAARAEFFHRGLMIRSENVRAALQAAIRTKK